MPFTVRNRAPLLIARIVRLYLRYAPGTVLKETLARYLNPVLRRMRLEFVATTSDGKKVSGNTHDLIQRYLYMFGVWEPELTCWLKKHLVPGDVFIDIGANIGYFTLLGSKLVGAKGEVIAIEPSPIAFSALAANVSANSQWNIRLVQMAVSDRRAQLVLNQLRSDNLGATTHLPLVAAPHRQFAVAADSISNIVTTRELSLARVIKIDVEGSEPSILRELATFAGRLHPNVAIVVEIDPELIAMQGTTVDVVLAPLVSAGFCTYWIPNDYSPAFYARRSARGVAPRWSGAIRKKIDLILSRIDASWL